MDKFRAPVAVIVLITRMRGGRREVLLQRRQNTGFGDGMWDFSCSGHVEDGESMTRACARECSEELSIAAEAENFSFFTIIYKRDGKISYVNPYFHLTKYAGEPRINEPDKCSALEWFDESALPEDLLPDRREAYRAFLNGKPFIEYGWQK